MTKALMERALEAEMTTHLGYAKHDQEVKPNGNRRNGKSQKTWCAERPGRNPYEQSMEICLKYRLQDQLQRHLRHAIAQRGDTEQAQLAALLRYRHLPHRQRTEAAVPQ